jgi:hypothetical protein
MPNKKIDIAERITFCGWLKNQPTELQDKMLGKTKAKLLRSGKLIIRGMNLIKLTTTKLRAKNDG